MPWSAASETRRGPRRASPERLSILDGIHADSRLVDTIDAACRLVSALGACTALWVFANHLVDVLAASRGVTVEEPDTPTQSDHPGDSGQVRYNA